MSFQEEVQAVVRQNTTQQAETEASTEQEEPESLFRRERDTEAEPKPKRRKKAVIIGIIAASVLTLSFTVIGALTGGESRTDQSAEEKITFTSLLMEEADRIEAREAVRERSSRMRLKTREPEKSGLARLLDNLLTNVRGLFN